MDWIIGAATVVVTAVGLWLANSYRRQISLKLAQTRLEAYSHLWEITGGAAPTRLDGWGDDGYLSLDERRELWAAMTDWYYANGGGMLLTAITRQVYLNVKHDLVCEPSDLRPAQLDDRIKQALDLSDGQDLSPKVMGTLSIRLVSLLRTQLKSDLTIYGPTYSGKLNAYECFFLKNSGVKLRSKAWASAVGPDVRWRRLFRLPKVPDTSMKKKQASPKSGRPQPSPLLDMSAFLSLGKTPQIPPSSRAALDKTHGGDPVDSAQADGGMQKVLPDDGDVEGHSVTRP
jgi:hypothetical protein